MHTSREPRLRLAGWAWVAMVTAAGVGLIVPSLAEASCAGPQVGLEQAGTPLVPRRVGTGEDRRVVYDVRRAQSLVVRGSNLTFGCSDTGSSPGCSAPDSDPVVPLQGGQLALVQTGRTWELGPLGEVGPDLTGQAEVALPSEASAGSAVLTLTDAQANGVRVDVVLV